MKLIPSDSHNSASAEQARWLAEQIQPHEPALRRYLQAQFPSIDADDAIQESYLKLLRIRTGGRVNSAKAYFFSVARNTARTLFRRRQFYSNIPLNELPDSLVLDPGPDAAETANSRQRVALAVEAIDRLPARCREIIKIATFEGAPTAEIAGRLGLSESTVRVQLMQGIKKCARYVRKRKEGR